jgi:predicted phosphodiesterase
MVLLNCLWFDTFDIMKIDNRNIFLSHYPMLAKPMAKSWDFDACFYWHNHLKHKEKIENCLLLNPGEIGAYKTWIATFAIYDTKTNDAEIIEVKNTITANTLESQKKFKEITNKTWNN